jgi:3-isopropylmalate/(R)-2-methylmalate dehydratase small subunit
MLHHGRVHKVGDHIDTDAIIPARFLVTTDSAKLGENCIAGLEPGWTARVRKGDILAAGRNFGCGSSREHAPVAILGAGIPVVIAHSFARIFYRNAFNTGLLAVEAGDAADGINDGDELEVDTRAGTVLNKNTGRSISFPPMPPSIRELLDRGGMIPYVRERLKARADCR